MHINDEAYFLADADEYKESPEFYWAFAEQLIKFIIKSPHEIADEIKQTFDDNGLPKNYNLDAQLKKSRILHQRFEKHPNPELETMLHINSSIVYQHISKKWLEDGDKEFIESLVRDFNLTLENIPIQ